MVRYCAQDMNIQCYQWKSEDYFIEYSMGLTEPKSVAELAAKSSLRNVDFLRA